MAEKARLHKVYQDKIIPELKSRFQYKNVMQVPKLEKIVLSSGLGAAIGDKKLLEMAEQEFGLITGQKAILCRSKSDISNFKLRAGMPIGVKVTLRADKMYEFLDRFVNISIPRMRDFRGMNEKGFDGRGNYACGVKEQIIFPEIDVDKVYKINGMDVIFVTTAKTDEEAMELLKGFGFPFKAATTPAIV